MARSKSAARSRPSGVHRGSCQEACGGPTQPAGWTPTASQVPGGDECSRGLGPGVEREGLGGGSGSLIVPSPRLASTTAEVINMGERGAVSSAVRRA